MQPIASIPLVETEAKQLDVLRNKYFTKSKVVKFNTTEEVIENSCELDKKDEIMPRSSTETQSTAANDKLENNRSINLSEISRSPIQYNQTHVSNITGLAEAINVTLIKTKNTNETAQMIEQGSYLIDFHFSYLFRK